MTTPIDLPRTFCLGLIFNSTLDQLLLCKQNSSIPHLKDNYNGIGGKLRAGEPPVRAMIRECAEETGVQTNREQWLKFHYMRRNDGVILHCYATSFDDQQFRHTLLEANALGTAVFKNHHMFEWGASGMVYNIRYLAHMARAYIMHPEHRYTEG
jgi:8-oxo-dGTP pyrophosphatase MutT (NUDIX family)